MKIRQSLRRRRALILLTLLLVAASLVSWFLLAPEPSPKSQAADVDKLERALLDYSQACRDRNWPRAIELGLALNRLAPGNSNHQYNLACAYALSDEAELAVNWLTRSAESGFSLLRHFETDPDLESIREHAGYRAALALVHKNRGLELADLRTRFEETPMHVVLPPDHDISKPAPLIVALHGKGGRPQWIAGQWRHIAAEMGAILIAPQAVIPWGSGFSWNEADTNDSLGDNAEYLVRLTMESATDNHLIDKTRTVLTGFSEGGGACRWIGPRYPYMFAGAIPMGCDYLREFDKPPEAVGDRPPRFYFMAGQNDEAAPAGQLHMAREDYTAAGYETEMHIYPNAGHTFPTNRDEELRKAVEFVLGP